MDQTPIQPWRDLIAAVLYDAYDEALAGNIEAERWLTSRTCAAYCTALNVSHGALLDRFEQQQAARTRPSLRFPHRVPVRRSTTTGAREVVLQVLADQPGLIQREVIERARGEVGRSLVCRVLRELAQAGAIEAQAHGATIRYRLPASTQVGVAQEGNR